MSAFQQQLAVAVDQAMTQLGVTVVYGMPAGWEPLTVTARVAKTEYRMAEDGKIAVSAEGRDFLIRSADLVMDGAQYVPQRGDTITQTINGRTNTYTVIIPEGGSYCWEPADEYGIRRRIHTKLTEVS